MKKSAPTVAEAQESIGKLVSEQATTARGDIHAWDNPTLQMHDRGQIVVAAINVLETEREAGRCQLECLTFLARAYGFVSGMHDFERKTAAGLLGDPEDAELTAYISRVLEEAPQQLRSVLAAMLRTASRARPTLNALETLKASATREQQYALIEKSERYIMTIDPHPAIEHQLVIAHACYRDLRLDCARAAMTEIKRIEKSTGEHPSVSYDTMQKYDDAATALAPLAGREELSSLLRSGELNQTLKRTGDARKSYRAALQKFPEDARAYLELTALEHDNWTYLQLFEQLAMAGRENRTPELYKTVLGLWIGGTMRALTGGESTTPWREAYPRTRDLANAAVKLPPEENAGMTGLSVAVDGVAALIRPAGPEAQGPLVESLARSADTWDLNELRLRLLLALTDANNKRAALTIATIVKRDETAKPLARKVQLIRGVTMNDGPMLAALERDLTRLPSRTDEDNVLLLDVKAARSQRAMPFAWKKIADAYRALPAPSSEPEQRRRAHNLAVAEFKSHPKQAPYAVEAPPAAAKTEPVSGPGMPGVVVRRRVLVDVNPLVTGNVTSDVMQIAADVWLVEK